MGSIPTEQWAQVIEKTGGPVDYKKIPVQKPGPDEVLVNIKYSGVCHTDLHAVNGDWPLVSSNIILHIINGLHNTQCREGSSSSSFRTHTLELDTNLFPAHQATPRWWP
jgi:hypothetical protein